MNGQSTSDEQLMAQVATGNRDSLSSLMRRYASPLLTFLVRMTANHHVSEELFQEVFLAVWQKRQRYEFPRAFRAWLFGIAGNQCRAEYRRRRIPPDSPLFESTDPPVSPQSGPVELAVLSEQATAVQRAVVRLPDMQRQVVVLRVWNGFPYSEIAAALDRPEATVRSHMCLALKTLRQHLEHLPHATP